MTMQRAQFLLEQERYDLAEQELRRAIASDPDEPLAHVQLAAALVGQKRFQEALSEAKQAVQLAPDWSEAHAILASVFDDLEQYRQAEAAIREAVRLDPENADHHALHAHILVGQARWKEALASAERGLAIDAEHVTSANLRAVALVKLRRSDDASVVLNTALGRDPENPVTHANRGWALLEGGQHKPAMESFREALRLDPHQEWAREGIVSALKARNPAYRLLLAYFFWMSRMPPGLRTGVWIGLFVVTRLLRGVAKTNPAAAPFIQPLLFLYALFCLFTWIADPMFNLLLRFDPVGRYALSPRQSRSAVGVGLCVWSTLSGAIAWVMTGGMAAGIAGVWSVILLIPVSATLNATAKSSRWILGTLTTILVLVGFIGMVMSAVTEGFAPLLWYLGVLAAGSLLFAGVVNRRSA